MKTFLVICFVLIANVLAQPASDEQKEKLHKLQQECGKVSGIDAETLKKIEAYQAYPEDDKMKIHSKCVLKSVGVVNDADDGNVNAEAMTAILKKLVPGKENDIVKKCVVDKDPAGKGAFELGKCIYIEINALKA